VTIICLVSSAPTLAQDQARSRHEGFWIGFGIGGGSAKAENDTADALGGGAVYLRLGGTLSQKWLLGGELMAWGRGEDGATTSRANVSFTALFYPSDNAGFYLKGGVGSSYVNRTLTVIGTTASVERGGGGFTLGAGFDIRLGSNLYLTPNIDWMFQSIEEREGIQTKTHVTLLTLGLIWH